MKNIEKYRKVLSKVLLDLAELDESTIENILDDIDLTFHKKGEILILQGYQPKFSYFLVEGLVRQYITSPNGNEVTVDFHKENHSINIFTYVDREGKSLYSLQCLEDCVMAPCPYIPDEEMDEMYPEIRKMLKFFYTSQLTDIQKKYALFKVMSPEERYLEFKATEPDLMKRIPQKIISSYLDITPETFSRFKKRFGKE